MTEISGTFPAVGVKMDTDEGPSYVQLGEAATGTRQALMYFQITSGEHAGQRVPWIGFFTKDTVDGTLKALRTAGMKGEDLNALYGDNAQELNQAVDIVVEMKPNKDGTKSYPQVRWVNAPGGGMGLKLSKQIVGADRIKFAAQLKAKLKAIPEVHGAPPSDNPPEDRGDDPLTDSRLNNGSGGDSLPF